MLGLLCLISGRFALCTINPIYYLKETNIAALVLGLLSSFIFSKDSSAQEQAGMIFIHDINTFVLYIYGTDIVLLDVSYADPATSVGKTLRFGVGFGLLFYLTNFFLTSHAVLPRNYDVHPFPYGLGVIGTMILGLLFSNARGLVRYVKLYCHCIKYRVLIGDFLCSRSWVFYIATLVTAVLSVVGPAPKIELAYFMIFYIFALWPSTVEDIALNTRPGRTTVVAGLTYIFFVSQCIFFRSKF